MPLATLSTTPSSTINSKPSSPPPFKTTPLPSLVAPLKQKSIKPQLLKMYWVQLYSNLNRQ
jgi:hypothetical protein